MKLKGLVAVMALVAQPALAQRGWVQLGTATNGTVWTVNLDNIRQGKDAWLNEYWVVWTNADYSNKPSENAHYSKQLFHIKCATYEIRLSQYIDYDQSGRVLDSRQYSNAERFASAVPDSVGFELVRTVCGGLEY